MSETPSTSDAKTAAPPTDDDDIKETEEELMAALKAKQERRDAKKVCCGAALPLDGSSRKHLKFFIIYLFVKAGSAKVARIGASARRLGARVVEKAGIFDSWLRACTLINICACESQQEDLERLEKEEVSSRFVSLSFTMIY